MHRVNTLLLAVSGAYSTANLSGPAIKVQSLYVTCIARACVFDDSVHQLHVAAAGPFLLAILLWRLPVRAYV